VTPVARLAHLAVRDFRNLAKVELSPPAEGLVVVGENGQGKTNLLEAIYYLQILRSVRGARDQDLVRFGTDAFHLAATVDTDRCHEIGVGFERSTKRKRVRLDGDVPARLSDALGALPSVMFSPADAELVAGSPAARRRFLDIVLALTTPGYLVALQRYRAALVRRNAALRESARIARPSSASVAVWEPPLAEHGAVLVRERVAWVGEIAESFERLCRQIGETSPVRVRYASSLDVADAGAMALASALETKRAMDVKRGLTHVGPHRDDLSITIRGGDGAARELRTFGSAGQQRTAAIALRMLEARTFSERTSRTPVFLLDDPFAELDIRRSANVLDLLSRNGLGQTILAVPREGDIPVEFTGLARTRVTAGAVEPVEAA
jgi:DNA replication and repair protein RecF